ncbi:MAG: hypothetical protein AB3N20_05125 [Rhizobiaceae bacterium]
MSNIVDAQANIARAIKYPSIDARNWTLYFFFRVMRKSETRTFQDLLGQQLKAAGATKIAGSRGSVAKSGGTGDQDQAISLDDMVGSLVKQFAASLGSGGRIVEPEEESGESTIPGQWPNVPDAKKPSAAFLAWLQMVTSAEFDTEAEAIGDKKTASAVAAEVGGKVDTKTIHAELKKVLSSKTAGAEAMKVLSQFSKLSKAKDGPVKVATAVFTLILTGLNSPAQLGATFQALAGMGGTSQEDSQFAARFLFVLSAYFKVLLSSPDLLAGIIAKFEKNPAAAGAAALNGGLPMMCLFEIFRQATPWVRNKIKSGKEAAPVRPVMMSEADRADLKSTPAQETDRSKDAIPINIAFSHSGLEALSLHPETLRSFPDVFKEGMAARAERLGDTGASAPENWDGALGLKSIHGHFSSRFAIGADGDVADEAPWTGLREDIRMFNYRVGPRGKLLRALLATLFRPLGMEIMHIELGQDPYSVVERTDEDGCPGRRIMVPEKYRREHFGFRDGISQPFVDIGLAPPPSGGGTPRRNRTWDSVAPGEIFISEKDEDGHVQGQPANGALRAGATYEVFRKLEQDVIGFRNFLKSQRSTSDGQEKLAAQFMGRWKDGTPLVISPDHDMNLGRDLDSKTNDFLYAKDDPRGERCPLGAHIRRSNPRDIGGNADAKRHRILRRGIAYGGSLLPEGSNGDGEERGLLFVCVNSRIDLQFELVQSNWINNGEFLGQAGLGRCPVTGSNSGRVSDRFFEAGAIAPVHHIPRFVTTRGGDYFFLPSVKALRLMAKGEKFEPDAEWKGGGWLDDIVTPSMIAETRIRRYMARMLWLKDKERSIVIRPPATHPGGTLPYPHTIEEDPFAGDPITVVGLHKDVKKVLADNTGSELLFSVRNYRDACRRATRGYDLLIGTELGTSVEPTRKRLQEVLKLVWGRFSTHVNFQAEMAKIADKSINDAINRTKQRGQIDLVRDLATDTVYNIVSELFGVKGPSWLTEIAIALPFKRKQVGDLERDWLSAVKRDKPENPGQITLQLWSLIFLADLVGNQLRMGELNELARSSGAEFLGHLESELKKARTKRRTDPKTLLEMFVHCEGDAIQTVRNATGSGGNPNYSVDDYYIDVLVLMLELVGTPMSVIPTAWGNVIGGILNAGIDLQSLNAVFGDPGPDPFPVPPGGGVPEASWITRLAYEVDRLNPSFKMFLRRSEQTNVIDKELTIEKDHWVAALAVAANFDEQAFPEAFTFSLGKKYGGPRREMGNYLMFGSAGGNRDCWGRDRMALYLIVQFLRACCRLDGLRKVAGPGGDAQKLLKITIGQPARFARQRIKATA